MSEMPRDPLTALRQVPALTIPEWIAVHDACRVMVASIPEDASGRDDLVSALAKLERVREALDVLARSDLEVARYRRCGSCERGRHPECVGALCSCPCNDPEPDERKRGSEVMGSIEWVSDAPRGWRSKDGRFRIWQGVRNGWVLRDSDAPGDPVVAQSEANPEFMSLIRAKGRAQEIVNQEGDER